MTYLLDSTVLIDVLIGTAALSFSHSFPSKTFFWPVVR
jgi:hypothetical protein